MKTKDQIVKLLAEKKSHLDKIVEFYKQYPNDRKELQDDINSTKAEILTIEHILSD